VIQLKPNKFGMLNTHMENASEGQSICEAPGRNSSSHAISRCCMEDIDYRRWRWTTCHWLGYYTAGLYHLDHEYLNVITGIRCCANSFIFTGQPDSPITNHTEECSEMEWWSFKDAEITEGWFHCPLGMFLKGFRLTSTSGLHGIRKAVL